MYTVEVYKRDRRVKQGERRVQKVDHSTADRAAVDEVYAVKYPASKGYRYEIHETYVTRKNMMSGTEFQERYDTPYYCSPSSETYWSS
jgi:hypothetical protein